jgi:uroporphyrinogen-III decarboxylase
MITVKGGQADRVCLFDVPNNPALFRRHLGIENYYSEGVPMVRLSKAMGLDACLVGHRRYTGLITRQNRWLAAKSFMDEFGLTYHLGDATWPLAMPGKPVITDRSAWDKIKLLDPHDREDCDEIRKAAAEAHQGHDDDIAVVAGIRGAFAVLYIVMGLENLSLTLYDDPDLLLEMSERLSWYWAECALMAAEAGADAVFMANDMGLNGSTIIAPADLRKYFIPALQSQISRIKSAGLPVIYHSCGNIKAILPDLVDAGVDCYNNVQVAAGMDIAAVKRDYGDRLALMGNVDATNIMTTETPAVIETAVINTLKAAAVGGGHILATDHSFHMGIPLENVDTFLAAGMRWGAYPLALPDD